MQTIKTYKRIWWASKKVNLNVILNKRMEEKQGTFAPKQTSSSKSHNLFILAFLRAISFELSTSFEVAAPLFGTDPRHPFTKCFLSNFSKGVSCTE